eukprot:2254830-Prymnesium_polylepis.1
MERAAAYGGDVVGVEEAEREGLREEADAAQPGREDDEGAGGGVRGAVDVAQRLRARARDYYNPLARSATS